MYKVEIEKLDHFGNGIAKIDGKIVFVPKTLKGDIVVIEIQKETKKFLEGRVTKYIKKMPRRNVCPYSNVCGGCHLIDMNYKEQLEFKSDKIKELFKKNLGIDIYLDEVISDDEFYYRNKINLHVKDNKIGFYKEFSNDLVEIDECIITKKEINNIVKILKEIVKDNKIEEVMIRSNKGILLNIKGNVSKKIILKAFDNCEVIYLNDELIKGEGTITDNILDKKFRISSKSFFQVNTKVCSKIFAKVRNYLQNKNYHKALDLYCGTGIIGIIISDLVDEVTGIEVVIDAIKDANYNKKLNNIDNINFICDKVENRINEFKNIDLVIVDPPRSGLDKKSTKNILEIGPKNIIYISCDPSTLVRDLKELEKYYNIDEVSIADMFPNTYHVESIVLLQIKDEECKKKECK